LIAKSRIKNPTQDVTLTGDFPTETEGNITHSPMVVNPPKHEFLKNLFAGFWHPNLPEQTIFSAWPRVALFSANCIIGESTVGGIFVG